ncbi:MAG: sirohydrochlorin cobaltochelatase [Bacteroidaceae bacterium]|nr:sirohydrochlorin cobaltochelatase [Bacteroidaceae bacterium]
MKHPLLRTLLICLIALTCNENRILAQEQNDGTAVDMFANMKKGDKAAIVAVHFGTTNDEGRVECIERLNTHLHQAFPKYDLREAWTSTIVINKMAAKGVVKQTPSQVLQQLKDDGFTHILIQPSFIIDGVEMEYLKVTVNNFVKSFKAIRLGQPLLLFPEDYSKAIDIEKSIFKDKKYMNVLVCHGSVASKNYQYTMLDYMLREKGFENWTVATIEGFPSYDNLIRRLKDEGKKRVNLIPFMFVTGEHVKNDINDIWKKKLEKDGFKVKTHTKGLGHTDAILKLYVEHAQHTQKFRTYSPLERKMMRLAQE